jgi:tripartite ATP-independent transporter DctP family solute receptor
MSGEGKRAAERAVWAEITKPIHHNSVLEEHIMNHRSTIGSGVDRRTFLKASASIAVAAPLWGLSARHASAADFSYKLATGQDPTHPVNIRAQEACNKIRQATGGKLDIKVFPANQLGSDTDLLSQVRSGGVEFFNQASSILATLTPAAGIVNTGFAFPDYDTVWKAMDGDLGGYIRSQIEKSGILTVSRPWDNGFRQISSSTRVIKKPEDLKGFKIRVPQAPMLTSLFKALDAGPTPINFNELYSALQTGVVEGQENPLPIIATAKLYEVQKSVSLTSHVWDGYWILGNRRAWEKLPADMRAIVTREFEAAALLERADIAKLNGTLRNELKGKGINVVDVDRPPFRDALRKTSFYSDWKSKYGAQGWSLLEKYVGKLV